ncbi:MAG: HD domain-containing phosphohydrolase [Oscillospiraceae bacterium]
MLYNIIFWGIPIFSLVMYLFLTFFFAISKKDRSILAFQPILFTFIVWVSSSLLMKLDFLPSPLFWNHMMMTAVFISTPLLYIFVSVFTSTVRPIRIAIFIIPNILLIVVNWMDLVVKSSEAVKTYITTASGNIIPHTEFVYQLGSWAIPAYIIMLFTIVANIIKVHNCVTIHKFDYKQMKPIIVGMILVFCGHLCNLLPTIGKYPIDILATAILGMGMTLAIYRYRMLEMRFMITRGVIYSAFTVLLMGTYVAIVLFADKLFNANNIIGSTKYLIPAVALLIALLFQPIFALASKISDYVCHRSEYSQRNALKEFSIIISDNLSLPDISIQLIEAIDRAMNSQKACLLLLDRDTGGYYTFKTANAISRMDIRLTAECPIVRQLKERKQCITAREIEMRAQYKSLWDEERRMIRDNNAEIFVPVVYRSELTGIIILAPKRNNVEYTLDDLDLLKSFGASTAMAISNAMMYAKAREDAYTDDLTGVYNRRYLFKYLGEQLAACKGRDILSIMVMDLDRFKLYNELYGVTEGDKSLIRVKEIITTTVDNHGIVARFSGGQFIAVMPGVDSSRAFELADGIRLKIQKAFLDGESITKQFLTISTGICTYPVCAADEENLIKRASIALMSAKENGRNCTVIYTPSQKNTPVSIPDDDRHNLRATVYALTAAIDAKDHYTFGHSLNVAKYASILAGHIGLDKHHADMVYEAGLLHDVGKIGIPEYVLTKSERLTNEEYGIIKKHVDISINIVKHLPNMTQVVPAVTGHHERWDGRGYPRGIAGDAIPVEARCLAIADAFDAITSARPYKTHLTVDYALCEIEKNMGTQFDPYLAKVFIHLVRDGTIPVSPTMALSEAVSAMPDFVR